MARTEPKIEMGFKLKHTMDGEKHMLTIIPKTECNFAPLPVEISPAQWDMMRFHFATAKDDKNKIDFLAYVI